MGIEVSEIWSKAPSDATHWGPDKDGYIEGWYKDNFFHPYAGDEWLPNTEWMVDSKRLPMLVKRPPAADNKDWIILSKRPKTTIEQIEDECLSEISGSGQLETPMEYQIRKKCNEMADFLIEKNKSYGNAFMEPCGVFAKRLDPLAQIDVRIDDKINRLMSGSEYPGDDTVKDLAGYLLLRMVAHEHDAQRGKEMIEEDVE